MRVLKNDLSILLILSESVKRFNEAEKVLNEKSIYLEVSPGARTVRYCSFVNPLRLRKSDLAFLTNSLTLYYWKGTLWRTL